MDGDLVKFVLTALGSGGVMAVLLRLLGPALKLNQNSSAASGRAIAQWQGLYDGQKRATDEALEALRDAEAQLRDAEERLRVAEERAHTQEVQLASTLARMNLIERNDRRKYDRS